MRLPVDARSDAEADVAAVEDLLRNRSVQPVFQPIVDLTTGAVVGVEALARGPAGSRLERPDQLFAAARLADKLSPVDLLCAERALECALEAPVAPPQVFLNAEPEVLHLPISPRLLELLLSGPPFRVVLEYTERALSHAPGALLRIAGMAQSMDNGIALDDVGADPMSLALLPLIEPDVIKLDMHLLRNPDAPATTEVCDAVEAAARRTGARVIAEGVETATDIAVARALGAHWGQGWHFGRPAPIAEVPLHFVDRVPTLRAPRPGRLRPADGPSETAVAGGAHPANATVIRGTLGRMTAAVDGGGAVVLGSYSSTDDIAPWAVFGAEVTGQALYSAMLRPEQARDVFPGESSLVVLTTDYAGALCRDPAGQILQTEDRDLVALIGQVLLRRLKP